MTVLSVGVLFLASAMCPVASAHPGDTPEELALPGRTPEEGPDSAGTPNRPRATHLAFPTNSSATTDATQNGPFIYYVSDASGVPKLWYLNLSVGAPSARQLFGGTDWEVSPEYSPGGTRLAFSRRVSGNWDIYRLSGSVSTLTRLTTSAAADGDPAWSPDGAHIAFDSNRAGNYEIYSMAEDGSDVHRLTNNAAKDLEPSWSPDRTKIAFASNRSGKFQIYTMNPDGSAVTRLASGLDDDSPAWSPDGAKIAFIRYDAGLSELWTMNRDGSGQQYLGNINTALNPEWSPDGSQIIYTSWWITAQGPGYTIYAADLRTYEVATHSAEYLATLACCDYNSEPTWLPSPSFPLVDAQFSGFAADIEWLYGSDITSGCSSERFCPDDLVTRGQMAAFLDRALHLPSTTTDYFTDDNGTTFEASINRLAASGITAGCTATTFCPTADVTRGQMAAFLDRAFHLPATSTDYFSDDNGTTFEGNINRLAASGITKGCTPTTFCPKADVTRGQMAAFLHRALTAYPVTVVAAGETDVRP